MKRVLVIGGGAAGLMAAYSAVCQGCQVIILEKMAAVGRKMLITGKGRCNITNDCDIKTFITNMPGNGPFLYSAFNAFGSQDIVKLLNEWGVATKTERGDRVFPVSDQASDVVMAFEHALKRRGVQVRCGEAVKGILVENGTVVGVVTNEQREYRTEAVILATGGASYPGTGSSGDGYRMAAALGHHIVPLKPSLVPLEVSEDWISDLQGLSLKNVRATVITGRNQIASEFGELLFTHYGLSGPIILSLSNNVADLLRQPGCPGVEVEINLKPALTEEQLDKRLQRDFAQYSRKQFKNSLNDLLPAKLINTIIDLAHIDPEKPVHQVTKEERSRLLWQLTHLSFMVTATRPLSEAIVTAGGVHTKEINPKTMESRLVPGLYFAGEVIDIDGYTGGFNLQAAFSTGYVAGNAAAAE